MTHDATQIGATTSMKQATPREPDERVGKTIGDFLILRRLGEGGMGQVYLAEQISLKRRVALKLLKPEFATNEISRRRFEAEAKAVAQLTHPSIVQVHWVGEEAGVPYMALEYVDGRNLRDYLLRKGPPEVPAALSVIRQVASALNRASELGIIHRDIKPENILLTKKGEVKVADFGLSRVISESQPANNLTQTGVAMGTPLYMSPEQVEGRPLDHRTDIYSLGVTCYHMLAGHPPFEGENAFAVAIQHVQNEAMPLASIRPDLPPALCEIVARMMEKNPADRYQTAREILQDLKKLSAMLAGGATQPLLAQTLPKSPTRPALTPAAALTLDLPISPTRKRLLWAVVVAATLVVTGGAGALIGWAMREPNDDPLANVPEPTKPAIDLGPLTSKQIEEAHLTLMKGTANPDPDRIATGVKHRIDLGLFYLDKTPRDLDKAEALFTDLLNSSTHEYKTIGKMGMFVVLAFRDKPEESLQQIKLPPGRPMDVRNELRLDLIRNPDWMRMIRSALEHDRTNLKAAGRDLPFRELPPPFKNLLSPPISPVRPGASPP